MGSYWVEITPEAVRSIAALPAKVRIAVLETIGGSIADDPRPAGKPLTNEPQGLYSARRGDFRVIYLIDDERRVVVVVRAHHRHDAYRPR